jgi:hypothetical protein
MKTRTTPSILIALLLAFLALGVSEAQASDPSQIPANLQNYIIRPVGITFGQTARVTAANTGTTAIPIESMKFLDSDGIVLAEFAGLAIDPGNMISFDLNADDFLREGERIEIRVVVTADTARGLLISTEVFENDTGKTTVFVAVGK